SRRRHTRWPRDWSSDVCSSDLAPGGAGARLAHQTAEALVRHHVDPWHGWPLTVDADDVLAPVGREAPVPVVEEERRLLASYGGRSEERRVGKGGRRRELGGE